MKIIRGVQTSTPKVLLYGLSGVGKSTLASRFSRPIFLDVEGSTDYLDVARVAVPDLATFYSSIVELVREPGEFDTVVVDSVDWLVRKVIEQVSGVAVASVNAKTWNDKYLATENTLNRAGGGYGNGKQILENHVNKMLFPALQSLLNAGYTVVLVAHAKLNKKNMSADGTTEEKVTPKIEQNTLDLFTEWCDHIIYLKEDAKGDRTIQFSSDDWVLAKNRVGLVGEMALTPEVNIEKVLKISHKAKATAPAKPIDTAAVAAASAKVEKQDDRAE